MIIKIKSAKINTHTHSEWNKLKTLFHDTNIEIANASFMMSWSSGDLETFLSPDDHETGYSELYVHLEKSYFISSSILNAEHNYKNGYKTTYFIFFWIFIIYMCVCEVGWLVFHFILTPPGNFMCINIYKVCKQIIFTIFKQVVCSLMVSSIAV